jgi:mannose/fructose/N-acetylgalactosamine-specific phosphotransferase system component IIC
LLVIRKVRSKIAGDKLDSLVGISGISWCFLILKSIIRWLEAIKESHLSYFLDAMTEFLLDGLHHKLKFLIPMGVEMQLVLLMEIRKCIYYYSRNYHGN